MANRQTLRDFQARLAERLQAARTHTSQSANWLGVQVGGRNYLLPLEHAEEIFPWTVTMQVPYAMSWFLGVANLRGNIVGVVDLCAWLGHPVQRSEQSLHEGSLLLLNPRLLAQTALLIDRFWGLRSEKDFASLLDASSEAVDSADSTWLGPCYVDHTGEIWQVLHLHFLVRSPEFLNIQRQLFDA